MELSKEKIEFYINASANPNHIDNQANGYKTILAKHHNQEQLKKHKAYEVLEKILFPNGRPSNKWKFWKN